VLIVAGAAVTAAPLGAGLLPSPVSEALGGRAAAAQSTPPATHTTGTPQECPGSPFEWKPQSGDPGHGTASECTLDLPACPVSPLDSARVMRLSAPTSETAARFGGMADRFPDGLDRYPEFCEERIPTGDSTHGTCLALKGVVVMAYTEGGTSGCRVLTPTACAEVPYNTGTVGMHRSGGQSCRAVQRRGWTCPAGYERSNAFNSCYRPATVDSDSEHPACGAGAPDFPVTDCAAYAGEDFLTSPDEIKCVDYDTGAAGGGLVVQMRERTGTAYWCDFNTAALEVECRRTPGAAGCGTSYAACLKRASRTGGCDQIARTIVCRGLQADFAGGAETEAEVRDQGCNPCPAPPFGPAASACPAAATDREPPNWAKRILRVKQDFAYSAAECRTVDTEADWTPGDDCDKKPVCADPVKGRLTWASEHHSGLAVANSPVTVRIVDIPVERRRERTLGLVVGNPPRIGNNNGELNFLHYTDGAGTAAPRMKTFSEAVSGRAYSSVSDRVSTFSGRESYECTARDDPVFQIVVRELWPDEDAERIKALFGEETLGWWNDLSPDEELAATEARGLASLTGSERAERLTATVQCRQDTYRTCHWHPARSGYFELTGAGAWRVKLSKARNWQGGWALYGLLPQELAKDGNRAKLQRLVNQTGQGAEFYGLTTTPELGASLSPGLDPATCSPWTSACRQPDREWLFTEDATSTAACGAVDVRVVCRSNRDTGNYTETEPVGVIVHEIQTRTVAVSPPD